VSFISIIFMISTRWYFM